MMKAACLAIALLWPVTVWANVQVWAPEVPGGYPYASKLQPGLGGTDCNMCWAAAASDLVEYWQQRYVQLTGRELPQGIPAGKEGSPRFSYVFDEFYQAWDNRGLGVEPGLFWYFSGAVHKRQTYLHDGFPGGYWKDYCAQLGYGSSYDELYSDPQSYHQGLFATVPTHSAPDGWKGFVDGLGNFIRSSLEGGSLVALSMKPNDNGGHVITLYGAEYDDDGNLAAVFVHDNNSRTQGFTRVVMTKEDETIMIDTDEKDVQQKVTYKVLKYGTWQVQAASALALPIVVPEPATAAFSLWGLALVAFRRRRV